MQPGPAVEIVHQPDRQVFVARVGGLEAVCAYRREGPALVLHHTAVPPALQGHGLAARLVQAALDWARAQGLVVRPVCSYVAAYMRRHPQTLDLLGPRSPR